jgi:hypothetical protein
MLYYYKEDGKLITTSHLRGYMSTLFYSFVASRPFSIDLTGLGLTLYLAADHSPHFSSALLC